MILETAFEIALYYIGAITISTVFSLGFMAILDWINSPGSKSTAKSEARK